MIKYKLYKSFYFHNGLSSLLFCFFVSLLGEAESFLFENVFILSSRVESVDFLFVECLMGVFLAIISLCLFSLLLLILP